MNRTIALLIPAILLAAMALIVFQQFKSSGDLEPISVNSSNAPASPYAPTPVDEASKAGGTVPPPAGNATATALSPASANATKSGAPENWVLPGETADKGAKEANQKNTPQAEASGAKTALGKMAEAQSPLPASTAGEKAAGKTETKTSAQTQKQPAASEKAALASKQPEQNTEQTSEQNASSHTMQSLSFKYQGSELLFILKADSRFDYKSFLLPSPERLVVDIAGNWQGLEAPTVPSNRLVSGVRLGKTDKGRRIVLDLKEAPNGSETTRDGATVTVRIY